MEMWLGSRARRSGVFRIKAGPTESGFTERQPPSYHPVGGEMLPVDKLSVFLSQYWLLILLLIVFPAALVLYKKRVVTLKFLTPLLFRMLELTRLF
jgi:hypothetical protein